MAQEYEILNALTSQVVLGTDVDSEQGVIDIVIGGVLRGYYVTGGRPGLGTTSTNIIVYNASFVDQGLTIDMTSEASPTEQVNGLSLNEARTELYVGGNNFPLGGPTGQIRVYTINQITLELTLDRVLDGAGVNAGYCEGCIVNPIGGNLFCVYHDLAEIREVTPTGTLVKVHPVVAPYAVPGTNGYQGGGWLGDLLLIPCHSNQADVNNIDADGRLDVLVHRNDNLILAGHINPPTDVGQDLGFSTLDPTKIIAAIRTGNNASTNNNVDQYSFTTLTKTIEGPSIVQGFSTFIVDPQTATPTLSGVVTPAGANKAILFLMTEMVPDAAITVLSAKYSGNDATEIDTVFNPGNAVTHNMISAWEMDLVDLPASGDVVIELSEAMDGGNDDAEIGILFLREAKQVGVEAKASAAALTVGVTTLGRNRTVIGLITDGTNTPGAVVLGNEQIYITQALSSEFDGVSTTQEALVAGVHTVSFTRAASDRPAVMAIAIANEELFDTFQVVGDTLEAGPNFTVSGYKTGQTVRVNDIDATETGGDLTNIVKNFVIDIIGASQEVEDVLARYSALTATEIAAITTFVDGLVADGTYTDITEIYAPCLNATDFLIGMKFMDLQPSASAPVHTPGEFVEFSTNAMHYLDSANFDTFANPEGFIGVYNVFTDADTTNNSDLFGVTDATNECYMRWRGNDTNDFNEIYCVTGATPRTVASNRPTGDLVGIGLEGTDVFNLEPGAIISKATRTPTAVPIGHPCQWHGQNINGTPAAGNVANSRYSLMMHSNGLLSSFAQGSVRTRVLQFLADIGVTGVPAASWVEDGWVEDGWVS